jgi:serine/threonine-protein kinase
MAVKSVEEFFAVLEKSKLLMPSQLAQARRAAEQKNDPMIVARNLAHLGLITRWQAGQLLAGRSSFYLGKYRLVELISHGGTGNVFLGRHVTMNRRVALKVVARRVSQDRELLKRFLAASRHIATLDHPNIAQTYSVDNEGDRYYLVIEYIEGVDFKRLVDDDGALDGDLAAEYVRQAADGVEHAHQQGMIHGNIQPSRLMVNLQGVVKILDFGLAWLDHYSEALPEGQEAGPSARSAYLAPEQLADPPHADARSDVYALGRVLQFLLMGEPAPRDSAMESADVHLLKPEIPADLAAICRKMTAAQPADRYPSAADAAGALADWLASLPPPDRDGPLPRAQRLDES